MIRLQQTGSAYQDKMCVLPKIMGKCLILIINASLFFSIYKERSKFLRKKCRQLSFHENLILRFHICHVAPRDHLPLHSCYSKIKYTRIKCFYRSCPLSAKGKKAVSIFHDITCSMDERSTQCWKVL